MDGLHVGVGERRKGKQMQNLFPLFERNRILKKELLWSLRDYSFSHVQLEYQEYSEGILQGCQIQVQYLKIKIEIDRRSPDYIAYEIQLILDLEPPQNENEFELCRFNLRSGAQLRDHYKDFTDMATEYDTIHLIHAQWGGPGGHSISPVVTRCFAESVLSYDNSLIEDRSFAYLILSQPGSLPVQVLTAYCENRMGEIIDDKQNIEVIYRCLDTILGSIQQGKRNHIRDKEERHRILVD